MDSNTRAGGGAELTAIDVLLEPDVTMVSKAEAANARLRENFPTGYALDALHAPHISVRGGPRNLDSGISGQSAPESGPVARESGARNEQKVPT